MSRSRAPELVVADDIVEYDLDSEPVEQRRRVMYRERYIHGEIYKVRPDVQAVVHNHSPALIPFVGEDRIIKEFGLSLASAVFLDALVVRCLLLPAVLHLVGRRTWSTPAWLERALPRLNIEGTVLPSRHRRGELAHRLGDAPGLSAAPAPRRGDRGGRELSLVRRGAAAIVALPLVLRRRAHVRVAVARRGHQPARAELGRAGVPAGARAGVGKRTRHVRRDHVRDPGRLLRRAAAARHHPERPHRVLGLLSHAPAGPGVAYARRRAQRRARPWSASSKEPSPAGRLPVGAPKTPLSCCAPDCWPRRFPAAGGRRRRKRIRGDRGNRRHRRDRRRRS